MHGRHAALLIALSAGMALAQTESPRRETDRPAANQGQDPSSKPASGTPLPPSDAPPRSDRATDAAEALPTLPSAVGDDRTFSSSREEALDLSPPKDDLKDHPGSAAAMERAEEEENAANGDVQEFHEWNPMKALKDVEIGDYYFKRKNYVAAMDRYKEALVYKSNDAIATFRLAVSQEKLGDKTGALTNYSGYLKILPSGPFADEARASIGRLGGEVPANKETASQAH